MTAAAAASPPHLFQRFGTIVYLMVALAFAGFASSERNPSLFFVGFSALFISWILVEGPRGRSLPKIIINFGVLAAAAILLGELVFSVQPNLLIALSHFIFAIILCKLFERKGNRDYGQILVLCLLNMVAASISSTSFAFSCLLILYLAVAGYAILIFHLRIEADPLKEKKRAGTVTPDEVPRIRSNLRSLALLALIILLLCTTVVFLAFPRWRGQDFFNNWANSGTLQTGFSDTVQLLDNAHLQQSDTLVMEVTLMEDGNNIGSETNQPYFRGNVLNVYSNYRKAWVRYDGKPDRIDDQRNNDTTRTDGESRKSNAGETIPLLDSNGENSQTFLTSHYVFRTVSPSATSVPTLFTIAPPISFIPDSDAPVTFNTDSLTLISKTTLPPNFSYSINSAILYHPPKSEDSPFLKTPGELGLSFSREGGQRMNYVSPQIMSLAHKIAADIVPAGRSPNISEIRPLAERFNNYVHDNYPYSLSFELYDSKLDPTTDFLVNHQKTGGYCEHFASAMAMLCRSMQLNARIVNGFHGGDFNIVSGTYLVKQKYAHSWVEVYIPDAGWVQFDPTPGGADSTDAFTAGKWFSDIFEVIQRSWLASVVSFDNSSRSEFFNSIAGWFNTIVEVPLAAINEVIFEVFLDSNANSAARWTGALTILAILLLTAWLFAKFQRRRTSQVEHILKNVDPRVHKQLAHELHFFDDLLRLLAKTGIKKSPQQTPREYVDAISPRLNGTAEDARWLVDTFYDIRFGSLRASQILRIRINSALHRVRHNLHHPLAKKEAPGSQPPC